MSVTRDPLTGARVAPAQSLVVDRIASGVWDRAAIARDTGDTELAMQVCRELGQIESDYEIRMRTGADERRASVARGDVVAGRPMAARYPGRCTVCSQRIDEGDMIVYDRETRRTAHERCGEVEL